MNDRFQEHEFIRQDREGQTTRFVLLDTLSPLQITIQGVSTERARPVAYRAMKELLR